MLKASIWSQSTTLLNDGSLPIIAPLGTTRDGQLVNINADIAAVALGKHIQPEKMIFLTETGGILDSHREYYIRH